MKILFLTFYFEPDLCAGSFRNTPLFRELLRQMNEKDWIHVVIFKIKVLQVKLLSRN